MHQLILSLYSTCCTIPKSYNSLTSKSEKKTIKIQIYMQFSVQLVTIQCTLCTARGKKNIYCIFSTSTLYLIQSYQQVKPYHAQHCLLGCLISCLSLYNQLRYLQIQQIFYKKKKNLMQVKRKEISIPPKGPQV